MIPLAAQSSGHAGGWIASSAPLHEHERWGALAAAPLDSVEGAGALLAMLRDDALVHDTEHLAIRGRRAVSGEAPGRRRTT